MNFFSMNECFPFTNLASTSPPLGPPLSREVLLFRESLLKLLAFLVKLLLRKGFSTPPPLSPYQQFMEKMSSKECGPLIEHFKSQSLRVLGAKFERNRLQVLRKSYRYSHSWAMITRKTYLNLWWFWAILRWAEMNCECVPCNVRISKLQLHEH